MSSMAAKKKLLMAQKKGLDVSKVFNISLISGSGAKTIVSGLDMAGEGGLAWLKSRSGAGGHLLWDTVRGSYYLSTNLADGQGAVSGFVANANGFTTPPLFGGAETAAAWSFRRAKRFFDIVQYTGNGVAGRAIAHNLGIKPGMIIVKQVDGARNWPVYHRSEGATKYGYLNATDNFETTPAVWNNVEPTEFDFTISSNLLVNINGGTYIAYLFAHDPSPDGIIQCGVTTGGSNVVLGWRPQYVLLKTPSALSSWFIHDAARGISSPGTDAILRADLASAEVSGDYFSLNSDGFRPESGAWGSLSLIYMAIREAA